MFLKQSNFSTTNILLLFITNTFHKIFYVKNYFFTLYAFWNIFIWKINFLPTYYIRNENTWNDGFIFDFLQKKTADAWVRRFVIYTGFLFSERVVFEFIVRIYLDNVIWKLHRNNLLELSNASEMLVTTIFMILVIIQFVFITLIYTVI